ncbi:MAG: hypothetical protein U1F46_11460 [Marinagarivorans sp.]
MLSLKSDVSIAVVMNQPSSGAKWMAKADCYLNPQQRLKVIGVAVLMLACVSSTWTLSLPPTNAATASDPHTRTLAGYISQEKRFLMYLFNGNAGKAQIA